MLDYRLIMSVRFIERCEENGKGRETQAGYSVKKKKKKKEKKRHALACAYDAHSTVPLTRLAPL